MYKEKGFTLVELLITLGVLSIVLVGVTKLFISTNHLYHRNQAIVNMQQELRNTRSILVNDLEIAGYDPTGNAGNATVRYADSASVRIAGDLDEDGSCDGKNEDVFYQMKENVLKRNGKILNKNLRELKFFYELKNGAEVKFPSNTEDVRNIKFRICAKLGDDFSGRNYSYCLEDSVVCRNMYLKGYVYWEVDIMNLRCFYNMIALFFCF